MNRGRRVFNYLFDAWSECYWVLKERGFSPLTMLRVTFNLGLAISCVDCRSKSVHRFKNEVPMMRYCCLLVAALLLIALVSPAVAVPPFYIEFKKDYLEQLKDRKFVETVDKA